jgi:hypothetical protein
MIQTGFESRVKVQQIVESQLPSFILDENPNASEFLKQYYISQEYQGGPIDIAENLDQYLKLDNLTPEVVVDSTTLSSDVSSSAESITVSSIKGFPSKYGLLKIDDEIITYTGITGSTFTGCIRGFSGITNYHQDLNQEELTFSTSNAAEHTADTTVQNLSSLFLKEFYQKIKYTIAPGLEKTEFTSELDVGNFLSEANSFYKAKGTDESFRILFNVLYNETPKIINLEEYLIKPSSAEYVKNEIILAEVISGSNPRNLVGQTVTKSTDSSTNASVSSVESFNRNNQQYYKISLFVGNDEFPTILGNFTITPNTKATSDSSASSSVVTVDSTIGFPESGTLVCGNNTITYTSKSINQFLGCSGITEDIAKNSVVRSNDTYFGYENGDTNKKVEFRILGVLSDFSASSNNIDVSEGDIITIKNVGDLIKNPQTKTQKQVFANSWIYNTAARYKVSSIGANYVLASNIDRSSLKVGDRVELLVRDTNTLVTSSDDPRITQIISDDTVEIGGGSFSTESGKKYDLRRKINTASSSGVSLEYGNGLITSDVQNLYSDGEDYMYVASNSLPSSALDDPYDYRYTISVDIKSASISSVNNLFNKNSDDEYDTIGFADAAPFITGDRVYYQPSSTALIGLEAGSYYVEVLSDNKKIKLYSSPAFVGSTPLKFRVPDSGVDTQTFTLYSQRSNQIGVQKVLKKFPLQSQVKSPGVETIPGTTGMLINGVEINNYKSLDKIYYGPLESLDVLNGGENFDVINLPTISIASGTSDALAQPVISGSIINVYIDAQDYDINKILSVDVSGGNGSGAILEPIIRKRVREIDFDGRTVVNGGGISTTGNRISFLTSHNLNNGEEVVYNSNGNSQVVIGSGSSTLINNSSYFVKVENNTTISLFESLDDYNNNTNIVGFTTGTQGTHKFKTVTPKNTISEIKVIDGGSGYTNRRLIVKPSGISTTTDSISFKDHGFNTGDLVTYEYQTSAITGISTSNQYYVLKIDDDSFRICNAGVAGTDTSFFNRKKYEVFSDAGSGYQYFSYPTISVSVKYNPVGFSTNTQTYQEIVATPVVRGSIEQVYLYENGTGYGSTILNYENNPTVTIKNGKNASLVPVISNGQVVSVDIQYSGEEYYSIPDLIVTDSSESGIGAELRPVISSGRITEVKVISGGSGYSDSSTSILVKPSGTNALLKSKIRALTVNENLRLGNEILQESDNKLKYTVSGYHEDLRTSFGESGSISGIIGWAYDGNPIYGPYGYSDPEDTSSSIVRISSGYVLDTTYTDRPSGFDSGFFVEDYKFTGSGSSLDKNNGRFGKTPEFPKGVYAYFASIDVSGTPEFPYFIGNTYKSETPIENTTLNQSFNFADSNLLRNTLPYKVSDENAGYDFISEIDDIKNQRIVVDSVSQGSVESIVIKNSGTGYKVNDVLDFNDDGGANATVSSVEGKDITSLETTVTSYEGSIFTWVDGETVRVSILPNHTLSNNDYVTISGLSTDLSKVNGVYKINVDSKSSVAISSISSVTSIGGTEIYVSGIPNNISIGSSIGIGTETLRVLELFHSENVIRAERGLTNVSHDANSTITFNPDSFTIKQNVDFFDSKVNDKVFFNPTEAVGYGTTAGTSYLTTLDFGDQTGIERGIPTKSIYLENHPFKNNQQIVYSTDGSDILVSTDGISANNLPSNVFVINKGKNLIGIKTTLGSEEVFFHSGGSDSDLYSFESQYTQITGKVEKVKTTVSVSTSHGLSVDDVISLTVNSNLSVGIGTSTAVRISRDQNRILVNSIGFSSTGINTSTNAITLTDHGLETGDKVYYSADSVASGLSVGDYYVFKIDSNSIKLTETYSDSVKVPPSVVSIAGTGGSSQSISQINPKILSTKNNNLVFDLSDSSLLDYKFRIYNDQNFEDEFVSTGSTTPFNVSGVGTIGVSTNASLTINYSSNLPQKLYYNLEKSGFISTADKDVNDYSQILFVDSVYNGSHSVVAVATTTFDLVLNRAPEKLSYTQSECDDLEYSTTSTTATGGVDKVRVISGGSGYKKLPVIGDVTSTNGKDSYLLTKSDTIGSIKELRIINEEFEYSFDPTLKPTAYISPNIVTIDSNTLDSVSVQNGGSGYTQSPNVIIVNSSTGNKINSGNLNAVLVGESIQSVEIVDNPKGLPEDSVSIITINNTNGISVQKVESSSTGIFTCSITVPPLGFTTAPFATGDKVFVEGIEKFGSDGSGFNSEDYGYKFLVVDSYISSTPYDKVVFDLSSTANSGLTTNTGIAKTSIGGFGSLVHFNDYPTFEVTQRRLEFNVGEQLTSNQTERDLFITSSDGTKLKVSGTYELSVGETITGKSTGTIATVNEIETNSGTFGVSYSIPKNVGWIDEIGKLNSDNQVTPDNNYYQNLSYSIKSSKGYEEVERSIKPLLHTSGLKDFADTGITSTSDASDLLGIDGTTVIRDFVDDLRVDTIYDFDFVRDIDIDTEGRSKYLKLLNTKLTDYTDNIGNDVLAIDDLSDQFSYFEDNPSEYLNLLKLDSSISFENFLIRITNSDNSEVQFTEVVLLNDGVNSFLVEKGGVVNAGSGTTSHIPDEQYGDLDIIVDEFNDSYLRFIPEDSYDTDYDLKLIRNTFTNSTSGIGTTSVGFIDLVSSTGVTTSGSTESIASFDNSEFESLYANVQIIDDTSNDMNFVELYVTTDGSNTYLSEYYFDSQSETSSLSNNFIGSFGANLSSGILSLNYTNTSSNNNTFRARVVGFGTTTSGIGTYRYKLDRQPEGSERSVIYKSDFTTGTGTATVVSLDKTIFNSVKSLVEISVGDTKSIHQIMMLQDNNDVYLQQSALLSVSGITTFDTAVGVGTFGGDNSGSNLELNFYPDSDYSSENIVISAFSQCFYDTLDTQNTPPSLEYGNTQESVDLKFYNSINGDRINKTNFTLTSEGTPIFVKVFDPEDTNALIATTGRFNVKNHFFKNGEELIYTPKSTIVGIATTAMTYSNADSGVTDTLPSTVFAVVTNRDYDQFQISTTRSGTAVTFTDLGGGNAHQFEMAKKSEKSIIVVDNLIQHPLIFTNISHTLSNEIGVAITTFNLSGISSINPSDILKIDDEYLRVTNVGLGTSSTGPITNNGSFNLVQTDRGFVGSSATSHTSSTQVDIYRGAFNIVENEIHFADAPRGNPQIDKTKFNLDYETSSFNGRVFLRSDYTTNKIYDDLSSEFNGIGRTFTLQVGGADTTGIGTIGGSGIVLINGIFQQPTTSNNPSGNFEIIEDTDAGISTITFSGITVPDSDPLEYIVSVIDINQNETPRGGIIVSLGSTPGLGFAPLVGASVTATVSAGAINGITTDLPGGSFGSGYNGLVSIGVTVVEDGHSGTPANITASVGAGGTLSFNVVSGGSGYTNPSVFVSSPSYENLSVVGVSRIGIGTTTTTGIGLSVSLSVGNVDTVGIASTHFGVSDFKISRNGYSFQRGDVFKPVGLVTDSRLSSPIHDFELTVLDTYSDTFASWEFGELDFIDSISDLQDGAKTTFPLFYNGELISFEKEPDSRIDLQNCLLIFINGVLQEPGVNYTFGGGTSFIFTTAPKPEDNISIYFYKGSSADVSTVTDIDETIKKGDIVQVPKFNDAPDILSQNKRTVTDLSFSDKFETETYSGPGVTETYRPLSWTKQKVDKNINGEFVSKARDSIESLIFPTANIIDDVSTTDTEIFVDSVELFKYEDPDLSSFDALIVGGISTASISTSTGNDSIELVKNFTTIQGDTGSVVGIASTSSPNLAIEFTLDSLVGTDLQVGYPIYIFNTSVGSGVTSINSSDSEVIGIGNTYIDNVYYVDSLNTSTGIITCRIHSESNVIGIDTTGTTNYPVGRYSWGRLSNTSGLERSSTNPISIGVTGNTISGLSTYPIIQRRNVGIRSTGALPKLL